MEERRQSLLQRVNWLGLSVPLLILFIPLMLLGFFIFLVYAFSHWSEFIAQSVSIVTWVLLFVSVCLYVALAYLAARVLLYLGRGFVELWLMLSRGMVEINRNSLEARGQLARNQLLYAAPNYVVHLERGQVIVTPVLERQMIATAYQDRALLEAPGATVDSEPDTLSVLSLAELLTQGIIQDTLSKGQMILGYMIDAQGCVSLRLGSWLDLYSCGIGGVSGAGKTTTVRFLLFQALLAGARLIMIDPHIGDPEESLAAQFKGFTDIHIMPPCDDTPKEVLKRVRHLTNELKRRKALGIKGPALILVIDELNAMFRVKEVTEELAELLAAIGQEGRKFGIFAMLIGQRWAENDLGGKNAGAVVRASLASKLCHRFSDEGQAKLFVGYKYGKLAPELEQGHYYFYDTHGHTCEMQTPATYVEDGVTIRRLRDGSETNQEIGRESTGNRLAYVPALPEHSETRALLESGLKHNGKQRDTGPLNDIQNELRKKARQVLKLLGEGKQKPEIVKLLWGVSPGGSQAYEQANSEYQQAMKIAYQMLGEE